MDPPICAETSTSREMPIRPFNGAGAGGWRSARDLILAAAFVLTGAGTIMLGVLLPALSAKWDLRDSAAGFLLFLQFAGSSLGSILTGLSRLRALRLGYAVLSASSFALVFAGPRSVFPIFFFFGLGLGLAMSATNLIFSDRYEAERARKLEALNFAWSAGAMASPPALLLLARTGHMRLLFFALGALFFASFVWALARERENETALHRPAPSEQLRSRAPRPMRTAAVGMLLALAFGSVGVEVSLSGWLTTYVHRIAPDSRAVFFPAALFYLGVVLSRLVFSTALLQKIGQRRALQWLLWATAAAVAVIVVLDRPALINAAAALAGLCMGPLFPLVLALLLSRASRGWIFAVAGAGAAVFPWLTGALSAHFGSLRCGLAAPLVAAVVMALLFPVCFRLRNCSADSFPAGDTAS